MKRAVVNTLIPVGWFSVLIAIWYFASSSGRVSFWILPSPIDVISVYFTKGTVLLYHLGYTLRAALLGFCLSIITGISVALMMDSSRFAKLSLYPYIVISQTIPIIAVAPLIIVWLGYGISSKVFTVLLTCFFPIALNFFDGLSSVSVDKVRLLQSMGASKVSTLLLLKIPSALPSLFTGLKISATYSILGAIIGEWLGGTGGLGIYMTRAAKSFNIDEVFAIIGVIIIVSLLLFYTLRMIEKKMLRWTQHDEDEYLDIER